MPEPKIAVPDVLLHRTDETKMTAEDAFVERLTPRESEIARLAATGLTNKEIALTLEISHWTVATHLRRIYDKTSICRRAALGQALVDR